MMHEDFRRVEKVKGSSDRSFGRVMSFVFLVAGLLPLLHAPHYPRWWAIGAAIAFALSAQWWTTPLAPLNRMWLRLGLLLHKIVSPVVLGLLFYLTVLPVGLLMRAFGKDPLRLHANRSSSSYWVICEPAGPSAKSMKHQF
jgi:hypothetical protein